jgi:exopolysaccharide biosynthesis protein
MPAIAGSLAVTAAATPDSGLYDYTYTFAITGTGLSVDNLFLGGDDLSPLHVALKVDGALASNWSWLGNDTPQNYLQFFSTDGSMLGSGDNLGVTFSSALAPASTHFALGLNSSTNATSNTVTGLLAPSAAAGVPEPGTFAIFLLGLAISAAIILRKKSPVFLGAVFLCCVHSQAASVTTSGWTPLYQGIDYATGSISGTDSSVAYAVRIDLTAPGIGFFTTPKGGTLNTVSETTSQFLVSSGAQVAINGNFFAPCCDAFPEDKTVIGLAVSDGTVVAPPNSGAGNSNVALLLSKLNQAAIATTTSSMDLSNVYNAVAGSALIVQNGLNIGAQSPSEGDPTHANPRTDAGISQNGQFLYLVAIDGRQTGYSVGTTMAETADIMIGFGAYTAMNLDGGGSTVLVRSNGQGGAVDLNRPSGGTERFDAEDLAVFAQALPTPEPGTVTLFPLAALGMLFVRRNTKRYSN